MKKVYAIGTVGAAMLFILLDYNARYFKETHCGFDESSFCDAIYNQVLSFGFILIFFAIATLIAYKLPENLFQRFIKFTGYSYLVYCVIVLLTPWEVGGGSFSGPDFSKGLMAWFLSLVYFIAAIIYIFILKRKAKR